MVSYVAKIGIVGSVGVVVIILASTLGWILVPNIIVSEAVIKDGSKSFDAWKIPPVPVTMQFFIYDCTNCLDKGVVTNKSFVPILEQKGPFTFNEQREKFNIEESEGLVTYKENISYIYANREGEDGLDTKITTVNPVFFTLASLIEDYVPEKDRENVSALVHRVLKASNEEPFMTHTVEELLFKGWSLQRLVEILQRIYTFISNQYPNLPEIDWPKDLRFGFFYGKNFTDSGTFTIESGANGLDELGIIKTWNGKPNLDYWDDQFCDQINGTDGAIYPPLVDTEKPIYLYTTDLCRSIYAEYSGVDTYTQDLKGYRFVVTSFVLGDVNTNPDNLCYCKDHKKENCYKAGILDMRPCQFGAPVLLSTPHFYNGDRSYVDSVIGLEPNQEWHETRFDLEPSTGVPLYACKRIQVNMDVRKYSMPDNLVNLPDIVFPIVWINESATIDEKSANDVKTLLSTVNGINIGRWCFLGAGIALVVAAGIMSLVHFMRRG